MLLLMGSSHVVIQLGLGSKGDSAQLAVVGEHVGEVARLDMVPDIARGAVGVVTDNTDVQAAHIVLAHIVL